MAQFINQDINDSNYVNKYTNLKNYILTNLGYPLVRIELTDQHLLTAIIDAVTKYHRYAAIDYDFIAVTDISSNPFNIPNKINKEVIVDVLFPRGFFDNLGAGIATGGFVGEFEGAIIPIFNQGGLLDVLGKFNLATYYTYLQKLEDIKKIIGVDRFWEIVGNQIHIFPKTAMITSCGILYKGKLTDSEIEEQDWIKEYALAKAKLMLGTVRSKFSGINAAGINIAADGENLKSEAREEINTLLERLYQMGRPMPFLQV